MNTYAAANHINDYDIGTLFWGAVVVVVLVAGGILIMNARRWIREKYFTTAESGVKGRAESKRGDYDVQSLRPEQRGSAGGYSGFDGVQGGWCDGGFGGDGGC